MIEREEKQSNEKVGDVFDILELSGRIHSKTKLLHRDFTLAHTDCGTEKFCKKQLTVAEMIYNNLSKIHEKSAKEVRDLLMMDIELTLVQTRSRKGRVLNAMLKAPYAHIEDDEKQDDKLGFLSKLITNRGQQSDEQPE